MTENRFVMVSEWMVKGHIKQFVEANPDADRLGLVRFSFKVFTFTYHLRRLTAQRRHYGVDLYPRRRCSPWRSQRGTFLNPVESGHNPVRSSHDPKVDILIDNNGRACLSDFSLVTIAAGQSIDISSWIEGGTLQWMGPELLDPGRFGLTKSRPTKESDCYALGMVIYEILSGQTPFYPSRPHITTFKVLDGQLPERPQGKEGALFTDDLWSILQLCWKYKPEERTNAEVVLQCLERTSLLRRPSSNVDRIVNTDTDESLDPTGSDSGMFSPFYRWPQKHHQSPSWYNRTVGYTS